MSDEAMRVEFEARRLEIQAAFEKKYPTLAGANPGLEIGPDGLYVSAPVAADYAVWCDAWQACARHYCGKAAQIVRDDYGEYARAVGRIERMVSGE